MRYVTIDDVLFVKYIDDDGILKLFSVDILINDLNDRYNYIDEYTETIKLILKDLKERKLITEND